MPKRRDSAAQTAFDFAAPSGERYDAGVELHKSYGPRGLSDLLPRQDLQPVIDYINNSFADQEFASKAIKDNVVPFPPKNRGKPGMQSVVLDDFQLVAQGQYWERPGLLGFDSMRSMVEGTPILNAIMQTRIHQVQRFCRVQADGVGPGFLIKHVDKTVELSDRQQKSVQALQGFMSNCGWESDPRKRKQLHRDSLPQFMAKMVRDSLTMDSAPIETEFKRDASLGIDAIYAVDGATIRLCTEEGYDGNDEIFALQVVQGRVRTAYTYEDLIYEVRNPRTDVTACGYGYSETEMLIRVVTYMLNAMTYNGKFFDANSIPKGIMHLTGNYDQNDIAAFKRYWSAMVKGVNNAWNLPVLVSKDQESKAEFSEINAGLDEMAFSKWLTWLTSIACAVYNISPEEISMESFSAGKSSLSGSDTGEKMANSTDKGLRPLLNYIENVMSDFVIRTFSDEFCFRFTGLDDEDPDTRAERDEKVQTWNEGRAQRGFDPVEGDLGDAPLNPVLMGAWQAQKQQELAEQQQQQQDQGDFGEVPPGEEDAGAEPPSGGDFGTPPSDDAGGGGEDVAKAFGMPAFVLAP